MSYLAILFGLAIIGLVSTVIFLVDHEIKVGRLPADDFYRWRHPEKDEQ